MSSKTAKKKDLEIICNLQWKHNGGDKGNNVIGVYDIPSTTLNWDTFKSYLLKNSGIAGDDVRVSYLAANEKEFPIESQLQFQIALYAFRKKARHNEIITLKLERICDQALKEMKELKDMKEMKESSSIDAETQFNSPTEDNATQHSSISNVEEAPDWFIQHMTQFKKEIITEITTKISSSIPTAKTVSVCPPFHLRKSKAESSKRARKYPFLLSDASNESGQLPHSVLRNARSSSQAFVNTENRLKEFVKSLKLERKLETKLEKLECKTKKIKEKKLALFTKSSDSDAEHSSGKSVPHNNSGKSVPQSNSGKSVPHSSSGKSVPSTSSQNNGWCEGKSVPLSTYKMEQMNGAPVKKQGSFIPHMVGGEVYLHQWDIINNGKLPWTSETELHFTWGSVALEPVDKIVPCPLLKPGEIGTIAVLLKIPETCGTYECYWYFHHKGRRFGHWLGCQVIVDQNNRGESHNTTFINEYNAIRNLGSNLEALRDLGNDLDTSRDLEASRRKSRTSRDFMLSRDLESDLKASGDLGHDLGASNNLENELKYPVMVKEPVDLCKCAESDYGAFRINKMEEGCFPVSIKKSLDMRRDKMAEVDVLNADLLRYGNEDVSSPVTMQKAMDLSNTSKEKLEESTEKIINKTTHEIEVEKVQSMVNELNIDDELFTSSSSDSDNLSIASLNFKEDEFYLVEMPQNDDLVNNIDRLCLKPCNSEEPDHDKFIPNVLDCSTPSPRKEEEEEELLIQAEGPHVESDGNNNTTENNDDKNEDGHISRSESIGKIDEDTSSESTAHDMVMVQFADDDDENTHSGYAYVLVEGQKVPVPKKFLRADYLQIAEEAPIPAKQSTSPITNDTPAINQNQEQNLIQETNIAIVGSKEISFEEDDVPKQGRVESVLFEDHFEVVCGEALHENAAYRRLGESRRFVFPQDRPGFEVIASHEGASQLEHNQVEAGVDPTNEGMCYQPQGGNWWQNYYMPDVIHNEVYDTVARPVVPPVSGGPMQLNFYPPGMFEAYPRMYQPTVTQQQRDSNIFGMFEPKPAAPCYPHTPPVSPLQESKQGIRQSITAQAQPDVAHAPVPNYQQTPSHARVNYVVEPVDYSQHPQQQQNMVGDLLYNGAFTTAAVAPTTLTHNYPPPYISDIQVEDSFTHSRAEAPVPVVNDTTAHVRTSTNLVTGAVNAASSAINTARSVLNKIVQPEPGRWVNGHWIPNSKETNREANLRALAEMGFWDRDLNATLLARYNDDIVRVVSDLIQ